MYKRLSQDELFKSYKAYERTVEIEVKSGRMEKSIARRLLSDAKKNYSNQNINRQMDRV